MPRLVGVGLDAHVRRTFDALGETVRARRALRGDLLLLSRGDDPRLRLGLSLGLELRLRLSLSFRLNRNGGGIDPRRLSLLVQRHWLLLLSHRSLLLCDRDRLLCEDGRVRRSFRQVSRCRVVVDCVRRGRSCGEPSDGRNDQRYGTPVRRVCSGWDSVLSVGPPGSIFLRKGFRLRVGLRQVSELLRRDSRGRTTSEPGLFGRRRGHLVELFRIDRSAFALVDRRHDENWIALSLLRRDRTLVLDREGVVLDRLGLRSKVFSEDRARVRGRAAVRRIDRAFLAKLVGDGGGPGSSSKSGCSGLDFFLLSLSFVSRCRLFSLSVDGGSFVRSEVLRSGRSGFGNAVDRRQGIESLIYRKSFGSAWTSQWHGTGAAPEEEDCGRLRRQVAR